MIRRHSNMPLTSNKMMNDKDVLKQINKSGFPFQLRVMDQIRQTADQHGWRISSYEHPWTDESSQTGGFIDIVLEHSRIVTARLVIECKRVKADDQRQLRWVFLLPEKKPIPTNIASCFELEGRGGRVESGAYEWNDLRLWDTVRLSPESFESGFCSLSGDDSGRKPLLEKLAFELLESLEGLAEEEVKVKKSAKERHLRLFVFPVVVTNAELFMCSFDSSRIEIDNGTLAFDDVEMKSVPFIRFRKSLETSFPTGEFYGLDAASKARERTIFIVNAARMSEFLNNWEFKAMQDRFAIQRAEL